MKKILTLLIAMVFATIANAQTPPSQQIKPDDIRPLVDMLILPKTQITTEAIYFDPDLKDKNQMCLDSYQNNKLATWVDEEGGSVRRFKENWELPSPKEAQKLSLAQYQSKADIASKKLKNYCVSVNLGVVADTFATKNEIIYKGRSYSSDPAVANEYADVWADSLRKNGIAVGWKHFPGNTDNIHVDTSNPAFKKAAWEQSMDMSSLSQIQAHARAFDNHGKADLLMVSQAIYPAIGNRPAVLEPAIVAMAHKVQPHSLLITDDLSELNLSDEDRIFLFENYDLVMFLNPKDAVQFLQVIYEATKDGRISLNEVHEKLAKIHGWKQSINRYH